MKISKKELAEIRRLVSEAQVLNYNYSAGCQKVLKRIIELLDLINKKKDCENND